MQAVAQHRFHAGVGVAATLLQSGAALPNATLQTALAALEATPGPGLLSETLRLHGVLASTAGPAAVVAVHLARALYLGAAGRDADALHHLKKSVASLRCRAHTAGWGAKC